MLTRLVLNRAGVKALLKDPRIQADLKRRADAIAAAAGPGHRSDTSIGPNRARATAITESFEAMYDEATKRTLSRAIDAGR